MKKLKKRLILLVGSNILKYLLMLILASAVVMDTAKIGICIISYAVSGKEVYLKNISIYALIISSAFILIVYVISKLKYKMYQSLVQMEKEKWERL
ncbi:hypothetical protein IMSAGC017_01939 [Thomasclavelia cocleata]|uniref:Uncharacterized protein n=1 Tax=Thomasclavelia cocleata TaxID=69824 RepID=A0A829ZBW1_9FIRM|nr:hypothetical protein [Thomasclavelia cocleata]GFI41893.1 hypothetical protein IMSAGC017_01939 [Thomasclavelia cocleata]